MPTTRWNYDDGTDPGIRLFSACLKAGAPIVFGRGDESPEPFRVLEVGCCESDWLQRAADCWRDARFVGIDVRTKVRLGTQLMAVQANVLDPDIVQPESLDAIVSLSAIEHVGLGHYGDPLAPDGDTKAITNCMRWLKPGGWLYFDVPYDPTGYRVHGTECRVYDDNALWDRLWVNPLCSVKGRALWRWTGYAPARDAGTLVEKPTASVEPFHYVAMVWRKVG